MTNQITTTMQGQARVPTGVVAAVAVTKVSRSAFFVLLMALVVYQFQVTYGMPAASTQRAFNIFYE